MNIVSFPLSWTKYHRKRSDMSEYRFCELFFPSTLIISGNENGGPRARESLCLKKNRLNVTYKNI